MCGISCVKKMHLNFLDFSNAFVNAVTDPDNPIAIIFIMVAWPEVTYGIDCYKKCSKRDFSQIVPVPDRGILKSSRALPEPIWTRISRSRRWDTSRSPKSPKSYVLHRKIYAAAPCRVLSGRWSSSIHDPRTDLLNENPSLIALGKKS